MKHSLRKFFLLTLLIIVSFGWFGFEWYVNETLPFSNFSTGFFDEQDETPEVAQENIIFKGEEGMYFSVNGEGTMLIYMGSLTYTPKSKQSEEKLIIQSVQWFRSSSQVFNLAQHRRSYQQQGVAEQAINFVAKELIRFTSSTITLSPNSQSKKNAAIKPVNSTQANSSRITLESKALDYLQNKQQLQANQQVIIRHQSGNINPIMKEAEGKQSWTTGNRATIDLATNQIRLYNGVRSHFSSLIEK